MTTPAEVTPPPEALMDVKPSIELGPARVDRPAADPERPPLTPEQAAQQNQMRCVAALQEVAASFGQRLYARVITRRIADGGLLCDAQWGVIPLDQATP